MYLAALALHNFRSYPQLVVDIPEGTSVILGRNGVGKTNVLEAISYLSTLSSHRVSSGRLLIHRPGNRFDETDSADSSVLGISEAGGAGVGVIRAKVIHPGQGPGATGRDRLLELEIMEAGANRARLNRSPVRPRELIGELPTVLFSPEDLALVKEGPAPRRRFLDELATQLQPSLAGVRQEYDRVARQRAALLKSLAGAHAGASEGELAPWDEQLATLGAQITLARLRLMTALREPLAQAYQQVSGQSKPAKIAYQPSLPQLPGVNLPGAGPAGAEASAAESVTPAALPALTDLTAALLAGLAQARREELRRGVNLVGPHRDDLQLDLGDLPVRGFASHGETWSFALSLRLAAFAVLEAEFDQPPLLLLDDVFAELDQTRRRALRQVMDRAGQVIVTAAVCGDVPADLDAQYFVANGLQVTACSSRPEESQLEAAL